MPDETAAARRTPLAVLGCGALALALLAAGPLYDTDGWWHLRTGELLLRTHHLARADPYSWTARGRPWQPNAWLADIAFALVHRAGGNVGTALFKAAAVLALAFALYGLCRRAGCRSWPAALTALGGISAAFLFVVERPQSFSFLLLAGVLVLADRALAGSDRALVGLGGLVALWANVHGVFVTGVAVVGATAAGRAVRERRLVRPALVGAVAVAAGLLSPFGLSNYTNAGRIRAASQGIREWQHLHPWGWPDRPLFLFLVAIVVALARTGRWRRLDVALPLLFLAAITVDAIRNGPLLVVAGAAEVGLALDTIRVAAPAPTFRRAYGALALVGWLFALRALVPYAIDEAGVPRASDFPVAAVRAIPHGCRLLNEYHFGGYLIWTRPDVPVSQDGRNDVYGRALLAREVQLLEARPSATVALDELDRWGVTCVLAFPDRPLVGALGASPAWRPVVTKGSGALYVRR